MGYNTMSVRSAVLSYLEDHAPAKPKDISVAVRKDVKQVYAAMYKLRDEGRLRSIKGKGWTVVHRAPKLKQILKENPAPKENTVRQYDKPNAEEARRQLELAQSEYDSLLQETKRKQKEYNDLFAVAKYLEKRNGQLLARIWEIEARTAQ